MQPTATGSAPTSSPNGVGGTFDLDEPFLLVSQHPVTTEYGEGEDQIRQTLEAVAASSELPAIVLWPNADAGSEDIARGMRKLREHERRLAHALLQEPADRATTSG